MRPPHLSFCWRVVLFAILGTAAYWTGRWQGLLAQKPAPEPKVHNAASLELAAKQAARAKAEELYLKLVADSTPAAKNNGIDLAKDLKGGLAKLAALPPGEKALKAYSDAFVAWAKDPVHSAEAAATAAALPLGPERMEAMNGVAGGWAQADPQKCLDWASSLPVNNGQVLETALEAVSNPTNNSRQPALAAQYVNKLQDASLRTEAIQRIAMYWGAGAHNNGFGDGADPVAALDWLDKIATSRETYGRPIGGMFYGLSENYNPALMSAALDKITEPDERKDEIASTASMLMGNDPDAALQWLKNLPDSDQAARAQGMSEIMGDLFKSNPNAAAPLLQEYPQALKDPDSPWEIAQSMAMADSSKALDWANTLPAGEAKNDALYAALNITSATDFNAALNYANHLPDADAAASVSGNLIGSLAGKNPGQAAALVAQLPTEAAKVAATDAIAWRWVTEDSAGFSNWLNSLPPGEQHDAAVSSAARGLGTLQLPESFKAKLFQSLHLKDPYGPP